jgi:hypothetical protein
MTMMMMATTMTVIDHNHGNDDYDNGDGYDQNTLRMRHLRALLLQ